MSTCTNTECVTPGELECVRRELSAEISQLHRELERNVRELTHHNTMHGHEHDRLEIRLKDKISWFPVFLGAYAIVVFVFVLVAFTSD